jgi:hypothetical protein
VSQKAILTGTTKDVLGCVDHACMGSCAWSKGRYGALSRNSSNNTGSALVSLKQAHAEQAWKACVRQLQSDASTLLAVPQCVQHRRGW